MSIPPWMQPTGWFQLGWSAEIAAGKIANHRCFGVDVIVYRGDDGVLRALDAHCQHLGAHVGHGGFVRGDCVVCPFHHWTWGPDGRNVAVPETEETNRSKCMRSWPVCERSGIVYIWNDVEGRAPLWEMPDVFAALDDGDPIGEFHDPYPAAVARYPRRRFQPRITIENIVDPWHIKYTHGAKHIPTLVDSEITDHTFMTKLTVPSRGRVVGDQSDKQDTVTLKAFGVGIQYTRFAGRDNSFGVFATTPEDGEFSTQFQTVWVERKLGEREDQTQARRDALLATVQEDFEIWEHQEYLEVPGLISAEARGFGAMRKWVRTFHPADTRS